jgi:ribosome biogenesis GTPase
MALIRKRRLTDQQTRRIEAQQTRRIDEDDTGELLEGLIITHYGRQLLVQQIGEDIDVKSNEPAQNDSEFTTPRKTIWRCHARTNLPVLVTGDRVRFQVDENTELGVITALHPRDNLLTRPDRYHKVKPVAANVTLIVVVFAALPVPSPMLIDRYLVACQQADIQALLVLGKADLLTEEDGLRNLLAEYTALGYDTLTVETDGDLSELIAKMTDKTVVFVGQSGVGKSSLINALIPDANLKVNIISENSALGQHTTTTTTLLPIPNGGALIDSPGIREFGVWHLTVDAIRNGFIEMYPYYGMCRFRNCLHKNEPGCALIAAAAEGKVLPRRLASLNRLEDEAREADKL